MEITEIVVLCLMCCFCFLIGARTGQKVSKGEEVKIVRSPVQVIEEIKDTKEQKKEIEKNKIIAENIDNYDGTSLGQKDLPR